MIRYLSFSIFTGYFVLFVNFVFTIHTYVRTKLPLVVDGIVVVTGQSGRVQTGLDLLKTYPCQLFISGVGNKVTLDDLLVQKNNIRPDDKQRIILGHQAKNTQENAVEISNWVKCHNIRSLILITHAYHMPRLFLYVRNVVPFDTHLFPYSIKTMVSLWRFFMEMHKYYYVKLMTSKMFYKLYTSS